MLIPLRSLPLSPVLDRSHGSGTKKRDVLFGFYRFAMLRGYAATSPLPTVVPKPPQAFTPYIYSREEIGRLLHAADVCENPRGSIQTHTYRTLILLLYGAGLRIGEALALTLNDVDLPSADPPYS